MDFIQNLDPSKLVTLGAGVAFFSTIFSSMPSYNLPIMLFGAYAQENSEAIHSIKLFTALLGSSVLWDIYFVFKLESVLARLTLLALTVFKLPTFLAFATSMRQRGAHFSGIGLGGGETVWSMPGGFTSGGNDGYQPVGDARPPPPPVSRAPAPAAPAAQAGHGNAPVPGAYQAV